LKTSFGQKHIKKAIFDYADKLKLRRSSDSTFRIYGRYFKLFLSAHIHKLPEEITDEEIKAFLLDIFTTNDYASKTQNQIITAIKFYYEQVLGLNKKQYWIDRPRKESKLPLIISEKDVLKWLTAASNLMHNSNVV
jgi:integrase/recombinase XerD